MKEPRVLRLSDLLAQKAFGLELVVPGVVDPEVSGAHTSEIHEPARWFEPGNLMLTTGMRLPGDAHPVAPARELVEGLRRAKIAALLFGVGVYHQKVPQALVDACAESGVPLVSVAQEVPFHQIENFVNRSAQEPDSYGLKRMMWLTNDLLDSISTEEPMRSLIARLATACRGTAVLYGTSGEIIESTGEGPTNLIFSAISSQPARFERVSIGRWEVMYRSMVLRGRGYHLAIATRQGAMLDDLGDVLLETTQRMLGAINGISQLDVSRQRHDNAQMLTSLQDGIAVARELRYWELLKPFGFTGFEPVRAVVATTLNDAPLLPARVDSLIDSADRLGLPMLFAENGKTPEVPAGFHAVMPQTRATEQWLAANAEDLVVGMSEASSALSYIPELFMDADLAAAIARRRLVPGTGKGHLVKMDDADPASWLLARLKSPTDRKRLNVFVQPLRHDKELVETLQAYLAMDQDIARVAAWLYVHPNTVRYRIKKAGDLLGGSLNEAGIVSNLYLAYHDEIGRLRIQHAHPE
ncbi:PucR family transcriptional regulator [Paeniglutamicibacter sp. R2-26]|uniref:PucR family transcriptional regulator n=1 Tax=Paeniglutamicibacter sp. R2-26 TaxID=3144417 RepID=UPI003EE4B3AE